MRTCMYTFLRCNSENIIQLNARAHITQCNKIDKTFDICRITTSKSLSSDFEMNDEMALRSFAWDKLCY